MANLDPDIDYAFYQTLYEAIELVIHHCNQVQDSETLIGMGLRLKMASRALRCALEIYGSQCEEVRKRGVT